MASLVIFGVSNILGDIFDCAFALGIDLGRIVIDQPETIGPRDRGLADRLAALDKPPAVEQLADFQPGPDELYVIGPTTPKRADLVRRLEASFAIGFHTLVHPTAHVSPMARLGAGVFIGANSVIAPGAVLADHVFVNRSVTVGHDTEVASYTRLMPGCNVGGLVRIGAGCTIGLGAAVIERLVIGDGATIGAGAVVIDDVEANTLVTGSPARFTKRF